MNETISPAQTNHLAVQLLKDYGIEADALSDGEIINLINLIMMYQHTRHQMQMAKDFNFDFENTLRQDI